MGGVLRIASDATGPVLRYHLISRALLFCFLAPLLFIALGQLTIELGKFEKPPAEAKAAGKDAKKDVVVPLNPIDKFLGAPAPEKPKKDDKDGGGRHKKATPTAAYVFAGIFAVLYIGGRILEDRLVRRVVPAVAAGGAVKGLRRQRAKGPFEPATVLNCALFRH